MASQTIKRWTDGVVLDASGPDVGRILDGLYSVHKSLGQRDRHVTRAELDSHRAAVADAVEYLRTLREVRPSSAPQATPVAWMVERDGEPWELYGPPSLHHPADKAEAEAAFWHERMRQDGKGYHTARVRPLGYLDTAPSPADGREL